MPNWSSSDLHDYIRKRNARKQDNPGDPPANAIIESPAVHGPLAAQPGEAGNAGRSLVRITSYRIRLLDLDNLYGGCKFTVDSIRYSKLIRDDNPAAIELEVRQEKVAHKKDQKTIVEIIPI